MPSPTFVALEHAFNYVLVALPVSVLFGLAAPAHYALAMQHLVIILLWS